MNFYKFDDKSVRLTGRWGVYRGNVAATANGAKIEIAFRGTMAVLHFNMAENCDFVPHLWISVDGGAKVESAVQRYIRVECEEDAEHIITVIMKSSVEPQQRWYAPLVAKVEFEGYEAEESAALPENNKKIIEFVGDSITEGVLIDASYAPDKTYEGKNRPFQDDSTATYAYIAAKNLGLEPIIMGYGAVGLTHSGQGSVPESNISYPYCFDGAPINHHPDYIVINLGTNDRWTEETRANLPIKYKEFLGLLLKMHPQAKIAAMIPFVNCFGDEIKGVVREVNEENGTDIKVVDTAGWLPAEPLHPLRDGHKIAAEKLTPILKEYFGL